MLRGTLLFLSEQPLARRVFGGPLAKPLVSRFVAGITLPEAIANVQKLNAAGMTATLDYLGESVGNAAEAGTAAAQYIAILHAIERAGAQCNASLKLTQMGLDVDRELCARNVERIVAQAAQFGNFIRIDMEGSGYTQATLDLFEQLYARHQNVGVVIQAYLYRSEADIRALNKLGARVRLCKGAYNEPASVAFAAKADTDKNYVKLMQLLLSEGNYPGIATHDEAMIAATREYARAQGIAPDRFEFQMLYGIRRDLQEQLVREGYRLRVYVPYGEQWYPYMMRRMAERPANLLFVLRGGLR
ncbi:MAG TPA: proline dehydrogenase family protein [Kouleothrix sp.]|uniref:proline dehydrogenase family protein n=1 Tax=Kouleothrix sp. TaxID=2779161 RepID=UPI002B5E0535|nr:proline dehydrogenase family protein [Kouleothrix sp.]HRC75751.1 proline dehydrogenase family protein [Kouleothrix sp.]